MIEFVNAKKNYIIALAVLFVLVSLSGPTYSLFLKTDTTNTFNYNTGLLDLQFIEDEQITIQNAFPIIDSEGLKQEAYTLTIKNTGSLAYSFDLKMLSETADNVINTRYIKVQVNDQMPSTLYETNNVIASNLILYPEEEMTFKIKTWLDINTPNNELGKIFIAKIVTEGSSIYKTLDSSGANYPDLNSDLIPVYYDEENGTWRKADSSNTISTYEWYNYDNKKWANAITIKNNDKQIYDITRNHNLSVTDVRINSGNIIIDENYLDLTIKNYNYNNISNIMRVKFDIFEEDKIYLISNSNMSYYYDNQSKKFIFKVGNSSISSATYPIEEKKWYILGYTYNSNEVSFYIDGIKLSSHSIGGTVNSNSSFKIGTDSKAEATSRITVGDIYLYNDILTETEISENYKNSINIIYDHLFAGYNEFTPMTLKEYYITNDIGTAINTADIATHYVWIPRFKYKLWNVTGEENVDSYDAYHKGIDIIFEQDNATSGIIRCQNSQCYSDELLITKVTKNDNDKYYTHPAFTNLDEEVTGLWVSKYEISTTSSQCNENTRTGCLSTDLNIESKAGNYTWTNNYLSNFYQAIKKINTNINYHMIKNTEWGAITYLTHSKYGLCSDTGCKSIGVNNSYVQGTSPIDTTTDNIYGVFDMGGGATEFVMANYADENQKLNLTNTNFQNILIPENDYDLYLNNTFLLGDATKELSITGGIWNNNTSNYIDETNNWFIRGGIAEQENSGIFYYNATNDISSEYISTRIVIK